MSFLLTNNLGQKIGVANGMMDFLLMSGCGLVLGYGPGRSKQKLVYLHDEYSSGDFDLKTPEDCQLFAKLLRLTLEVTKVRNECFVKEHGRPVYSADRTLDEHSVLPEDDMDFYQRMADFFDRSSTVRCW